MKIWWGGGVANMEEGAMYITQNYTGGENLFDINKSGR